MKLELKGIYKSFGEKQVLKGISFSAESGKAFGPPLWRRTKAREQLMPPWRRETDFS